MSDPTKDPCRHAHSSRQRHVASTYRDHRRAIIDIVVLVVILGVIYWMIPDLQLFEALYAYTRAHEDEQIDEIIIVVLLATVGLVIFGARRLSDQRREIHARQKAEDRASRSPSPIR